MCALAGELTRAPCWFGASQLRDPAARREVNPLSREHPEDDQVVPNLAELGPGHSF
jgi:hypothetical protein